jgi:hypothetical protein
MLRAYPDIFRPQNCLHSKDERFFLNRRCKKKRFFLAVMKNERIFVASKKTELK